MINSLRAENGANLWGLCGLYKRKEARAQQAQQIVGPHLPHLAFISCRVRLPLSKSTAWSVSDPAGETRQGPEWYAADAE